MTGYQKDILITVAVRLRGESIRREHDLAEAVGIGDWYAAYVHHRAAGELRDEAEACFAATR